MWIYYIIIVLLIAGIIFAFYRVDMYKAYDVHHKKEVDKLEIELAKERDVSSKAINELNEVAYTNPITKLGNIDYFIAKTEAMFKQSPGAHYTLVAFNIMNIGKINQLFGPTEGDNVILYAADVLKEVARRRHHLHAQIYSNLFGLMIKAESDEIVMEQINTITKKLKEYNENVQIESSFGI